MATQVQPKFAFTRLITKPTSHIILQFLPNHRAIQNQTYPNRLYQWPWSTTSRMDASDSQAASACWSQHACYSHLRSIDHDPADEGAADPNHGHDCVAVVHDMKQLISQVATDLMDLAGLASLQLVLVGNEVGFTIARLYAHEYSGTVSGILFLDSALTNTDFVSLFPDPDISTSANILPQDTTTEDLRSAREKTGAVFHPDVANREGLSRRNLMQLLPRADSPKLIGPDGRGPFITVVGHDFNAYAQQTKKTMGIATEMVQAYVNPYWQRCNEGLALLTESERCSGPFQAPGTGYFVQADNPDFVAERLYEMLQKLWDM